MGGGGGEGNGGAPHGDWVAADPWLGDTGGGLRASGPTARLARDLVYVTLQVRLGFIIFIPPPPPSLIDLFIFFLLVFILGPLQGGESFFFLSGVWVALKNIIGNLVLGLFY